MPPAAQSDDIFWLRKCICKRPTGSPSKLNYESLFQAEDSGKKLDYKADFFFI